MFDVVVCLPGHADFLAELCDGLAVTDGIEIRDLLTDMSWNSHLHIPTRTTSKKLIDITPTNPMDSPSKNQLDSLSKKPMDSPSKKSLDRTFLGHRHEFSVTARFF